MPPQDADPVGGDTALQIVFVDGPEDQPPQLEAPVIEGETR